MNRCDVCGEEKPGVRGRVDPYVLELEDRWVVRLFCDDCFEDRKGDV